MCRWSQEPEEVEFELTVLERLAERYGRRKGLWGIEIINEPALEGIWKSMDVPNRYPAADQEKAAGSGPNTAEFLRWYYMEAYDRMRRFLPEEKYIVFHDGFELKLWKDFTERSEGKSFQTPGRSEDRCRTEKGEEENENRQESQCKINVYRTFWIRRR